MHIFFTLANTVGMEKEETKVVTEEKEIKKPIRDGGSSLKPVAVVIGGSSGIGREIALGLVSKGYTVINVSRRLCKNDRIKNVTADITQGEELERSIQNIGADYKRINLLCYSAGCSMAAPLEHAKESDVRYLFEVNYFGALRAIRTALPFMKRLGGKIFVIGSLASTYPVPFDCFYSSSKAALDMLVRGARTELKRYNVSLTCVQPGGTSTSFTFKRKVYSDEENGDYYKEVHKAIAALANMEQGGMSASSVAEEVIRETMKKNPAITLPTGGRNKAYVWARHMLPEKFTEFINDKMYNQ